MPTEISYWEARVMRHAKQGGPDEFAIHEVYFSENDEIVTWTEDTLSPREDSVQGLRETLEWFLAQPNEHIECGDLHYSYAKEDIENWLSHIDQPVIDYI